MRDAGNMRGLPSALFFRVYGLVREGQLKDCHIHI